MFRVLAALLCFAPLWRARGVFGVGTSLGSPAPTSAMPSGDPGCLSVPPPPPRTLLCSEAKGWLDFQLGSLILPSLWSRWRNGGWDAGAGQALAGGSTCARNSLGAQPQLEDSVHFLDLTSLSSSILSSLFHHPSSSHIAPPLPSLL